MAYKIKKHPTKSIPKAQFAFWIITRIALLVCAGYSFVKMCIRDRCNGAAFLDKGSVYIYLAYIIYDNSNTVAFLI